MMKRKAYMTIFLTLISALVYGQNTNQENVALLIGKWKLVSIGADEEVGAPEISNEILDQEQFSPNDSIISFENNNLFSVNHSSKNENYKFGKYRKIVGFQYQLFLDGQEYWFVIHEDGKLQLLRTVDNEHSFGYSFERIKN